MNETRSPFATDGSSAELTSRLQPQGTQDDAAENIMEMSSFQHKVLLMYSDFKAFYCALPMWMRVMGTIMALVIIIDGAILFFTLIGAFGYLSDQTQASILEWSIQMINVCFTTLCLVELPFRLKAIQTWIILSRMSGDSSASCRGMASNSSDSEIYIDSSQDVRRCDLVKAYNRPTNEKSKWKLFGFLNIVKVFQIICQCWVEYLCLAYIGRQQQRPALWFGIAVGFALPVGCGLGGVEGYLKG